MKDQTKGILQMSACATLWSIGGIFIKLIPWNGFVIACFRSLIAAATVVVFMLITKHPFRMNKIVFLNGMFEGLLFIGFVVSNKLTTAANAIVLQFTCPIFLMLYSAVIFHKKLRRADVLAALFTLIGITLCFLDQMEGGHLLGNIVAIASGALMAAMYLCTSTLKEEERMSGMLTGHFVAALIGFPFIFFTDNTVTAVSVVCIFILGVVQLGASYILYVLSTKSCPPLACSLLGAIEPLLNPIWVALFGGEIPGLIALVGGIVVIATVTVWCATGNVKESN